MRYHITVMRPDGPDGFYSNAFNEVCETLAYGLLALGHEVSHKRNRFVAAAQNIVLGPQFVDSSSEFPEGTILYNLEPIGGNPHMLMSPELSRRYTIWDYSPANIAYWHQHDIDAICVPVGYVRELTRIIPAPRPDIDVLFFGSVNSRRAKIIGQLQEALGERMMVLQRFGRMRDDAISRSRIVLNLHYYDSPRIFEWVRTSYLLANMKCVVSETSDDFPLALVGAVADVPYDKLVEECLRLLDATEERLCYQERGFHLFSKIREIDILKAALCKTDSQHSAHESRVSA
jgi:hypothetical protein